MNDAMNNWNVQLVLLLALVAAVVAVFWAAEGVGSALVSGAILLAFVALVHFGRGRSGTIEVMSGVGDERTRSLYARAAAFCGNVMAFVLPGWWLVTVAQGDPNETLGILSALFGVCFIAAVFVLARRG